MARTTIGQPGPKANDPTFTHKQSESKLGIFGVIDMLEMFLYRAAVCTRNR